MPVLKLFYGSGWRTANSQLFKVSAARRITQMSLVNRKVTVIKVKEQMFEVKETEGVTLKKHCHLSINLQKMLGDGGATAIKWAIKWSTVNMWTLKGGKKKFFHTSTLHLSISTTLQPYCWHGTITIPLLEQTSVRF